MVQFHEHIITDLLDDLSGGLVVLSSGLALHKLIASLLHLHHSSQNTILILSASPSQKQSILFNLQNPFSSFTTNTTINTHITNSPPNINNKIINSPPDTNNEITNLNTTNSKITNLPSEISLGKNSSNYEFTNLPSEITSDLPAQQRLSLYTSGGVFFVTARILIVDLLTRRLPVTAVSGIILLNAHALSDTSTEAFIVRILRSGNPLVYVRAFSDRPQAMVSGFAKAERIMKCLFIRKLYLWPRFQVLVSQDLERDQPEVVDIRVPMSNYMIGIQKAVIEVMDACLKEMRKTNKVDVEDLTVENGLFKSFDEIVRMQLDPIWHTLGKKTKQLVSDLKTLRKLLEYLVRYDAVTYLKYLDSLRASESFRSVWIFAESSYKIFEYAKKRVYIFGRSGNEKQLVQSKTNAGKKRNLDDDNKDNKSGASTSSSVILEEILEEPPKWKVMRELLEEIQEEREKQALSGEELDSGGVHDGIILVACKDERSCTQLEDCITKGSRKVMKEEWEKYLLSKVELQALPKYNKKKVKQPKGFGVLDGNIPSTSGQKADVSSLSMQEHDALLAAASEVSKNQKKDDVNQSDMCNKEQEKGGRKGKKKKTSTAKTNGMPSTKPKSLYIESNNGSDVAHESPCEDGLSDSAVLRKHTEAVDAEPPSPSKRLPEVHYYAIEGDQHVLDILLPSVIIVYQPDMAFVREVEIYKAENPSRRLKVYFLFYEDSTEVQKYEASVRRENKAFESLIRQKSLMMIPVDQDGRSLGLHSSIESQSTTSQNSITRKAGGRKEVEKEMQVIVDMREFMSSLPNVLHQKGMRIIPVTLEVGDYILSPSICVERKSIQDLFGSFASGRLYHQAEMMSRYYRIPVLLIEFSQDKSFSFQSASDIGDDVTPNNIISKLSLLVLHFPRLRVVWSRSLHATADIFSSLKANQDEPDEVKAIRVGVPSEEGIVESDVRAENYNTSAVEFLRRLPGVTDSNYRSIMDGCKSLAELALLPMEKLGELMGGQKAAKTLRDFLDAKYPTLL